MSAAELWQRLAGEGLVEGEYAPPSRTESPWFVRVMLGFAGWLGAIFLLMFVGVALATIVTDPTSAFIVGLACCGAALFLFRAFDGNDFAEQFGLAISIAGKILIVIGLAQTMRWNVPSFYLVLAAIEMVLVFAIPNFLHRALSSAGAGLTLALSMVMFGFHGLAAPLLGLCLVIIWLEPRLWAAHGRLWRPIGYGLALALLLIEIFRMFELGTWLGIGVENRSVLALYGPIVGRAMSGALLVCVAMLVARREGSKPLMILSAALGALVFGALAVAAPGLASAVLILLLGFAAGTRLLLGMGILALLGFVGRFYYSLHATLLEKSGLLALTGLILLLAFAALRLFAPHEPAAEVAHA